ncbi:MAG: hypothetical protein WKF87_18165 [Chryseolinea sp.]
MLNTIYLIAAVALTLALFRIARVLGVHNRTVQKVMPVLVMLELVLWTIIVFWSTSIFLSSRSYYPILVLTLAIVFTLLITWFYLKDIVAGYIFRMRHNPVKGQILTCQTGHGSIRILGLSQLTIETKEGRWLRIPYSSVVTNSLSLQSPQRIIAGETTLELSAIRWDNPSKMERVLKKALAQSPWWISSKPIKIHFSPEEKRIKISFFLLDHVYVQQVKDRLTTSLENLNSITGNPYT